MTTQVHPGQLHRCGSAVYYAGIDSGELAARTRTSVTDGSSWGDDEIGLAVHEVFGPTAEPAMDFVDQVGFCLAETGTGLHDMARAYDTVETENVAEAARATAVAARLRMS